jgi:hypothetical protein
MAANSQTPHRSPENRDRNADHGFALRNRPLSGDAQQSEFRSNVPLPSKPDSTGSICIVVATTSPTSDSPSQAARQVTL